MKSTNKGFSLIELSIVLIIIGLLVAGITGGASLIKSAELRSVMSEVRNYQTAVNAYYTATGKLPGGLDSDQLDFAKTGVAWNDIYAEGIIDEIPTTTSSLSTGSLTSDYGMPSKIKGSYYVLGNNATMDMNVIFMVAGSETPAALKGTTSATTPANASIPSKDAKFLDEKMDNGVIDSGKIYSFTPSSEGASCSYSATSTSKDCAIAFGIGL